jgi:hypothetical protein
MDRFKMNFSNLNNQLIHQVMTNKKSHQLSSSNLKLSSSMIERVHRAKPGCSACGKKVM